MTRGAVGSFIAGAAVMYFADPNRGRRRRAAACDRFIATWHDVANELDKAECDLWNRTHGVGAAVSSLWKRADAGESVVIERVRTAVGRAVSHPHAIHTLFEGTGRVVLEGPVLRHEVDYLLKRVGKVSGVREVVNRLQIHADPSGISSLQGGLPRRALPELAHQNWTPSLRVAAGVLAGATFYGSARNSGPTRWVGAVGSALLLARAIGNRPFRQMLGFAGGAGAINFDKTIHINAPVDEVYAYWANFENFPRFMTHLKTVRHLKNGRSHWIAAGPGGISIPWDAKITEQRTNQLLAWTSLPGSVNW